MHERQRMELDPIHDTDPDLPTIQCWPACIISPIQRPKHRHRKEANLSQPRHRPEFKPRPLRLCMHSTLSNLQLLRTGWRGKDVGMHHISGSSLSIVTGVLPDNFFNTQIFDGDVFESTTTTSQHDGTTCTHTMNNPTPII